MLSLLLDNLAGSSAAEEADEEAEAVGALVGMLLVSHTNSLLVVRATAVPASLDRERLSTASCCCYYDYYERNTNDTNTV